MAFQVSSKVTSGILVVPGLGSKWSVNEIEIQILELEPFQTRMESRFDALGPVIGVPQLCGNENVFARDVCSGKPCLQRLAYLALVAVTFRAIEVAKSGFQRGCGRSYGYGWIRNQGAETERGHATGTVVQ